MLNSGMPRADAEADFLRARRQQVLAAVARRFRDDRRETAAPLSFDDAVRALGYRGEHRLGEQPIRLDQVVGSVDKTREFDRGFHPTSGRSRARWERIAEMVRRGEELPPIEVYRLGELYFVRDGHHRVSVAKALGLEVIDADVIAIATTISPTGISGEGDLDAKHWRRIFLERVPLTGAARASFDVTNPDYYHHAAGMVEAWSARTMHAEKAYMDKATAAARWYAEEFRPVVDMIDQFDLARPGETAVDAYLRVAGERYAITREHTWDIEVLEAIQQHGKLR